MSQIMIDFGIKEALQLLGVSSINKGTSTGTQWYQGGSEIISHSPVDGAL